jgi:hypothetical protein
MCSVRDRADRAHANFSSARAELLCAVAEVLSTKAWHGDGAGDPASWLAARWQMAARTARELVRDAEALAARPALRSALAAGALSVDQSKALTVLCGEGTDDDELWLESLPFWSYSELEREARKQTARELERKDGGTYLRMAHTRDERFLRGEFRLHPEDGAVLMIAVDARVPSGTRLRDYDAAAADALVELAKGSSGNTAAQRPVVLVDDGVGELSSGGLVGAETAERVACDASIQTGYTTRASVPSATRRKVESRDGGRCTFPGCEHDVFLDCHHIVHRANGGSNDASNLQLVCWKHHALIHEHGWSLEGEAGHRCTWMRPDGTPFEPRVRIVEDTS